MKFIYLLLLSSIAFFSCQRENNENIPTNPDHSDSSSFYVILDQDGMHKEIVDTSRLYDHENPRVFETIIDDNWSMINTHAELVYPIVNSDTNGVFPLEIIKSMNNGLQVAPPSVSDIRALVGRKVFDYINIGTNKDIYMYFYDSYKMPLLQPGDSDFVYNSFFEDNDVNHYIEITKADSINTLDNGDIVMTIEGNFNVRVGQYVARFNPITFTVEVDQQARSIIYYRNGRFRLPLIVR